MRQGVERVLERAANAQDAAELEPGPWRSRARRPRRWRDGPRRSVEPPLRLEQHAEIVVRRGELRLQRERAAEARLGVVDGATGRCWAMPRLAQQTASSGASADGAARALRPPPRRGPAAAPAHPSAARPGRGRPLGERRIELVRGLRQPALRRQRLGAGETIAWSSRLRPARPGRRAAVVASGTRLSQAHPRPLRRALPGPDVDPGRGLGHESRPMALASTAGPESRRSVRLGGMRRGEEGCRSC